MKYSEIVDLQEIEMVSTIPVDNKPELDETNSKVMGTFDGYEIFGTTYFPDHHTFCIFDSNNLIAFLIVTDKLVDVIGSQYAEAVRIWVEPAFRGKGLATTLYAFVVKKMKVPLLVDNELTVMGSKQVIRMIDSGHFDVTFANTQTGEITKDQPNNLIPDRKNTWRIILENGNYGNKRGLFGHGERIVGENWFYRDSLESWE